MLAILHTLHCSIPTLYQTTVTVTASFSLRFTALLLAAELFQLLALRCGTVCHRRLRRRHLWRPSALDTRLLFTESFYDIRLMWHLLYTLSI